MRWLRLSNFLKKNAYCGGSLFVCLQVGFARGDENETKNNKLTTNYLN